jgi:hypothetical protein
VTLSVMRILMGVSKVATEPCHIKEGNSSGIWPLTVAPREGRFEGESSWRSRVGGWSPCTCTRMSRNAECRRLHAESVVPAWLQNHRRGGGAAGDRRVLVLAAEEGRRWPLRGLQKKQPQVVGTMELASRCRVLDAGKGEFTRPTARPGVRLAQRSDTGQRL